MDIQTYFARIDYHESSSPTLGTLTGVHQAHMLTIPFENLDIYQGKPISLRLQALWDKLILTRRGGFCYELNGMFAWLLEQIGFEVSYLNGRVYKEDGTCEREFDHLAMLVRIPGESERWLCDVGFGDSFLRPLKLVTVSEQVQGLRAFRLEKVGPGFNMVRRDFDGVWRPQYFFDLLPRNFPSDYLDSCRYHQTSARSTFTHGPIISLATQKGRITLDKSFYSTTKNGNQEKRALKSEDEFHTLLVQHYGIVLE